MKVCDKCKKEYDDGYSSCPYCQETKEEILICPNCHKEIINPVGEFCLNCGKRIIENCPVCGKEKETDGNYCENCGYDFIKHEAKKAVDHSNKKENKGSFIFDLILKILIMCFTLSLAIALLFSPIYKTHFAVYDGIPVEIETNFFDITEAGFKLISGYTDEDAVKELQEIEEVIDEMSDFDIKAFKKQFKKHNFLLCMSSCFGNFSNKYHQKSYVTGIYLILHSLFILAVIALLLTIFGITLYRTIRNKDHKSIIKPLTAVATMSIFAHLVLQFPILISTSIHSGIFLAIFIIALFILGLDYIYKIIFNERKFEFLPFILHISSIVIIVLLVGIITMNIGYVKFDFSRDSFGLLYYDVNSLNENVYGMHLFTMIDGLISENTSRYYDFKNMIAGISQYQNFGFYQSDVFSASLPFILTSNDVCIEATPFIFLVIIQGILTIAISILLSVYLSKKIVNFSTQTEGKNNFIIFITTIALTFITLILNIVASLIDHVEKLNYKLSPVILIAFILEFLEIGFIAIKKVKLSKNSFNEEDQEISEGVENAR